MADPIDLANVAGHVVTTGAGAGGVGLFMRWLQGKEAQEVSTQLALMRQQLDTLVAAASKHERAGERIALLEQAVRNLNERVDALVTPPPSAERRRR